MPKPSKIAARPRANARQKTLAPPPLPDALIPADQIRKVADAIQQMQHHEPGSQRFMGGGAAMKDALLYGVEQLVDLDIHYGLGWPTFLYIPSEADSKNYWPFQAAPAENRYAIDWTYSPIGYGNANKKDGTLQAVALSPTVKGAIEGKSEAGLGILFKAKHTLSRIRIEPQLIFKGIHRWSVTVDPVVWVNTRVTGSIYVGGFLQNPITGGFEALPNFKWRRHALFDVADSGSGSSMIFTDTLNLSGPQAGGDVLAEAGRTYLLAIVAQVTLKITTTNSSGHHVNVTNGNFDTWGSVVGLVREIWIDQKVYIQ